MREFERAANAHDVEALVACFAPDVVIHSPITERIRIEGVDQAADLFGRVFAVVSDIVVSETVGEGEVTQVVFWRGRVGGHALEEANLLRLDDEGRIAEMTVFMRPVPGLVALASRLATTLASRRGRARALAVGAVVRTIGLLYRSGEPLVVALIDTGVPSGVPERRPPGG